MSGKSSSIFTVSTNNCFIPITTQAVWQKCESIPKNLWFKKIYIAISIIWSIWQYNKVHAIVVSLGDVEAMTSAKKTAAAIPGKY